MTVVDGHARAAPASAAEPGPDLDVLDHVQQRVLWLATSIVHAANARRPHASGSRSAATRPRAPRWSGGRTSTEPLAAPTVRAIDAYVADNHPTTGPLFLDRTGTTRLAYRTAFDQLRRLAVMSTSRPPSRSHRTACATASSPRHSKPASRCKTSKMPPGIETPAPRGVTTAAATTSIDTRHTCWPRTCEEAEPATMTTRRHDGNAETRADQPRASDLCKARPITATARGR